MIKPADRLAVDRTRAPPVRGFPDAEYARRCHVVQNRKISDDIKLTRLKPSCLDGGMEVSNFNPALPDIAWTGANVTSSIGEALQRLYLL